jgi:lipopolysaccharide transport system ATP-binding protein
MYVRLAFAVAAHLEPKILFIDEVLAVGDASFQKKCLGKMGQVSRDGRTILFVSHNMAAVKALCSRALLMKNGTVAADGSVAEIVDEYLASVASNASFKEWPDPSEAPRNDNIRLSHVRITPPEGKPVITIDTGAQIEIGFENFRRDIYLGCTIYVTNSEGSIIFASGHPLSPDGDSRTGFYQLKGRIPGHLLNAGRYCMDVVFGKDQRYILHRVDQVVSFEVENVARGANMGVAPGVVRPCLSWSHSFSEEPALAEEPSSVQPQL